MSVNLHLSVSVRGYDPARCAAVRQAIEAVFEVEGIENEMSAVEESGEGEGGAGRVLQSRSNPKYPVVVSGAYEWVPKVQEALMEAVAGANGRPCEVEFAAEEADGREEDA